VRVYCILSDDRAFRSKSPAMHSSVLKRVGIQGTYVPFCVKPEDLQQAVSGLKALNIAGANVTVPYKEQVIPFLDFLSEEAESLGAVNTIVPKDGAFVGYNTDALGFVDTLGTADFSVTGKSVLLVGTGGAARAVAYALAGQGVKSTRVAGRDAKRTEKIAGDFGMEPIALTSLPGGTTNVDLLVNVTSASSPADSREMTDLVAAMRLVDCELVYDLNYGRKDNVWRTLADRSGSRFMDGLPMLAHQARRSFMLWTGLDVPVSEFEAPLMEQV
jgi:shikimate dehydrogenase